MWQFLFGSDGTTIHSQNNPSSTLFPSGWVGFGYKRIHFEQDHLAKGTIDDLHHHPHSTVCSNLSCRADWIMIKYSCDTFQQPSIHIVVVVSLFAYPISALHARGSFFQVISMYSVEPVWVTFQYNTTDRRENAERACCLPSYSHRHHHSFPFFLVLLPYVFISSFHNNNGLIYPVDLCFVGKDIISQLA